MPVGAVLGGHGMICWGCDERRVRGDVASTRSSGPSGSSRTRGARHPFGSPVDAMVAAPRRRAARRGRAARAGRARTRVDRPAGRRALHRRAGRSSTSSPARPRLGSPRWAPRAPTTSSRTKVRPLLLDLGPRVPGREHGSHDCASCMSAYRDEYAAYYERARHADDIAADARRRSGDRAGSRRGHVELRPRRARRRGSPASSS